MRLAVTAGPDDAHPGRTFIPSHRRCGNYAIERHKDTVRRSANFPTAVLGGEEKRCTDRNGEGMSCTLIDNSE